MIRIGFKRFSKGGVDYMLEKETEDIFDFATNRRMLLDIVIGFITGSCERHLPQEFLEM